MQGCGGVRLRTLRYNLLDRAWVDMVEDPQSSSSMLGGRTHDDGPSVVYYCIVIQKEWLARAIRLWAMDILVKGQLVGEGVRGCGELFYVPLHLH